MAGSITVDKYAGLHYWCLNTTSHEANRRHAVVFNRPNIFGTTKWCQLQPSASWRNGQHALSIGADAEWAPGAFRTWCWRSVVGFPAGNQATDLQTWSATSLKQLFQDIPKRPQFLHLPHGTIHYDRTVNTEAVKTTSDMHTGVLEWSGGENVWTRQRLDSNCIITKFKVCCHR